MHNKPHPWQSGRSGQFQGYLASLTPEERRRIEAEEQHYLEKRKARSSRQHRAARDFAAVMVGVREYV